MVYNELVIRGFFSWIFFLFFYFALALDARATLESCTASINTHSMATSSTENLTVSLTNTGSAPILYFKITTPSSSNLPIQGKDISGWSGTSDSSMAYFWGGSLGVGDSLNFVLTIGSGADELGSQNFVVVANDFLSGDGTTTCTGSLGMAISGITDVTAPSVVGDITISEITPSSAKVSWTSSEDVTTVLYYDTSTDYSLTKTNTTATSTHSVTLESLSADTKYYFYIRMVDGSDNSSETDEASFNTAKAGLTSEVQTVTTTTTVTTTNTVTKVLTDTTPPVIKIDSAGVLNQESGSMNHGGEGGIFESAPLIEGSASDDKGVARVEYRIKNYETNWSSAGISGEVGDKKVGFEFLPSVSLDGTYTMEVRAVDIFGNKSSVKSVKFVIDKLPPTVGGAVFTVDGVVLGSKTGGITVLENKKIVGVFKELGGAETVTVKIKGKEYPAVRDRSASVWSVDLTLDPGLHNSQIVAVDGTGKTVTRDWVKFEVLPMGKVTQSGIDTGAGKVQLWRKNSYGIFTKWEDGEKLGWVLPPGEYYVSFTLGGNRYISQVVEFATPGVLSGTWELGKRQWWTKYLPAGRVIEIYKSTLSTEAGVSLDPELVPNKWLGVNRMIYVVTPDLPYGTEGLIMAREKARTQGLALSVVGLQASQQEMDIWMEGKSEEYLADWEGKWLQGQTLKVLPTKYYLDTYGKVVNIEEGVY